VDINGNCNLILGELKKTVDGIGTKSAAALVSSISNCRRIFVAGCGRSGLMAKAFAMRLVHLGRQAYVVGDATTPAFGAGDLLVVCSGRGGNKTLCRFAQEAKNAGGRCAAVTASPDSPLAQLAETIVVFPAKESKQFGGSRFEQSLLIFFDALVIILADAAGTTYEEMAARHANIE